MPSSDTSLAYYSRTEVQQVLTDVSSSLNGISIDEAKKRIKEQGSNQINGGKRLSVVLEFLLHFNSPLTIILIIAAFVSGFFGGEDGILNAGIIVVMVLLSVILDFYLEHTAEKASEKLKATVQTNAVVLREGKKLEIPHTELCVGDIILLNAGSLVPADARLITAKDFFVNQSSLTGESFPSEKNADATPHDNISISEMKNIVFLGSNVVSGSAVAVIIKTGAHTEFGKIASKLSAAPLETEFSRGINNFGTLVMKATLFLVLFIFLFNSLVKHNVLESFIFAIAVAVGLTPELMPMIMSVAMAKGSMNMAKSGVIVKKLSSIPNLGSMDVLCTDKTGTLTEDKIKLVKYSDFNNKHSETVLLFAYLNSFYQTGIKNPLDAAVLDYKDIVVTGYKKCDEIPFDFIRKRMSVVVERNKKTMLITKGAPEEIFKVSKSINYSGKTVSLTPKLLATITKQYRELSEQGYRVLAVASKNIRSRGQYHKSDECDLTLMGFVAFLDPPKEDVKEVIEHLNSIGVDVKIVTGDNELVTKKICSEIGIHVKGVLLGSEIATINDEALRVKVEQTTIFARFSPSQKNRVILALKANGHVVGYMGDGINDAPSLKTADVGISVSSAVDVAKEAADIILTQKSLRVLEVGIIEGRKTFGNTMKYIMMNLSSNFGNMFSVAGAILFLPFLPMLPIQILLNNFIYDFSQVTIPSDSVDQEYIKKPKRWNMKFIKNFMFWFGPASSLFDFLTFGILYFVFAFATPEKAGLFQTAWFIESLATQTFVVYIIRTKKIPFIQSSPSIPLMISSVGCVLFAVYLTYTPLGNFFGFVPLPWIVMVSIIGIVISYLIMVEFIKRLFYKYNTI